MTTHIIRGSGATPARRMPPGAGPDAALYPFFGDCLTNDTKTNERTDVKPKNREEEKRLYRHLAVRVRDRVEAIQRSDAGEGAKAVEILGVYERFARGQRAEGARDALGGRVGVGEGELTEAFAALDRELERAGKGRGR